MQITSIPNICMQTLKDSCKIISLRLKNTLSTKQIERICPISYKTIERALKKWRIKLGTDNNYIKETTLREGIRLTHTRPCMKNDNAHAEQRNRTHVRVLFARYRFDDPKDVDEMNCIYEQAYKFRNFILLCKVLKTRIFNKEKQRYRRVYDKAKTPVERIQDFSDTSEEIRKELKSTLAALNYYDESIKLQSMFNEFFSKERNGNAEERAC